MFDELRNKDVYLMLDGARVRTRSFLGFAISTGSRMFYYKNVHLTESSTADVILREINECVDELRAKDIRVFSVVADNASSMQRALRELKEMHMTDEECVDDEDDGVAAGMSTDDVISTASVELERMGILVYRCSAHSLQLLLKDFVQLQGLAEWKEEILEMLDDYKSTETAGWLKNSQEQNNVSPVLTVLRATTVRWNSLCEAAERLLKLKPFLKRKHQDNRDSFWELTQFFVVMSAPIKTLTNSLQATKSSLCEMAEGVTKLREKLEAAASTEFVTNSPDMSDLATQLLGLYDDRVEKNFSFDAKKIFTFLHPATERVNWCPDEVEEHETRLMKYLIPFARVRGFTARPKVEDEDTLEERLETEVGGTVGRRAL